MPAYNPPAQTLFSPVSNYYKGKAIRQQLAAGEQDAEFKSLQIKSAKQELKDAPSKREAAKKFAEAQLENVQSQIAERIRNGEIGELELNAKLLTPALEDYANEKDEDRAVDGFNEAMKSIIPSMSEKSQKAYAEAAGEDHSFDHREIMLTGLGVRSFTDSVKGDRTAQKFIDKDGNPIQGSMDKQGNYYDSSGKQRTDITPIAPQAGQADIGPTSDKTLNREIVKSEVASRNLVDLIDRTILQIDAMPQSGMGLTGKVVRGLDEIAAELTGIYEVIGGRDVVDGKEVRAGSLLDPGLYEWTGALANASAAVKSNIITMSYLKARAMEPGGRLAKDDVRLARDSLGGDWASKGKMKTALRETAWQGLNGLKNYYKATGNIGKFPKDLSEKMDKLSSGTFNTGVVPDGYDGPTATGANGELLILNEDGSKWIEP